MSAASEREKVLAQFKNKPCPITRDGTVRMMVNIDEMADEIVRLRAQFTRMACPVCGTVNPPEVHTCTPRATCTAEERAFLDTHPIDAAETRYLMLYRALTPEHQKQVRDYADMLATQHTVRRVALVEETRG